MKEEERPSIEEVLEYAEEQIKYYLRGAKHYPEELREEMAQEARLKALKAYERIDRLHGWKSYISRRCMSGVYDYMRCSQGFVELKLRKKEERAINAKPSLRISEPMREAMSLDDLLAENGIHSIDERFKIRWELLSKLARRDRGLELFIRHSLLGYSLRELEEHFGYSRRSLHTFISEFVRNLKKKAKSLWVKQIIYALGLSEHFQIEERDYSIGWSYEPLDLFSLKRVEKRQMSLFDSPLSDEKPREAKS